MKLFQVKYCLFAFVASLPFSALIAQEVVNHVVITPNDNAEAIIKKAANIVPSPRQLRWQQLELTSFIHFGMNTFTGNEWGDGKENPSLFNPTSLDAAQWVTVCKQAGIKQIILTAKHHDGFCLWPSKFTEHSVKNSPWKDGKGDVVKELSDACRKQGVGFGIYLSPWDRNNPDYGDTEKYNAYFLNQLTELLTNYGRIDEVWFDGANGEGPNGKKPVYHFEDWYALIRKLQPNAVISIMGPDVRWVGTESGYGRVTEWSVVPIEKQSNTEIEKNSQKDIAFAPKGDMTGDDLGGRAKILKAAELAWYPAETDVSIRPGWFYHEEQDTQVKSPDKLLDIYFSSVGRNSGLLLNIPPDKTGLINNHDVQNLKAWKALINKTFENNLLKGAHITSNGINNKALLNGSVKNYWTTKANDTTATINIDFKSTQTFDVLILKENIALGQRVENFCLEYFHDNAWEKVVDGTTIGSKRLLRFKPVSTQKIRLRILSSRLNPTLIGLGLYKQPEH